MKILLNNENYVPCTGDVDSGIATSADADIHSLEYDEQAPPQSLSLPITPQLIKKNTQIPRLYSNTSTTTSSTIRQHYYTEGGWGWIIVVVSVMVQTLTHGLHTSCGIFIIEAAKRYNINGIVNTGNVLVEVVFVTNIYGHSKLP